MGVDFAASLRDITPENVKDIPEPCRAYLYWESQASKDGKSPEEKDNQCASDL